MTPPTDECALVPARFLVTAETCPGLLPRLLQPLARRDLTADDFHAVREGGLVRAEIFLRAMPADMVGLVAGNLGQVIGVTAVRWETPSAFRSAA